MRFLRGIVASCAVCLLLSSCGDRALQEPKENEFVGLYQPENPKESGIRSDSALTIESNHRCKLVDFPVVSYSAGSIKPDLHYYTQDASWIFSTDGGDWNLAIFLKPNSIRNQSDISLRILSNRGYLVATVPYRVSQEGEDVDDDGLVFVQHPLGGK